MGGGGGGVRNAGVFGKLKGKQELAYRKSLCITRESTMWTICILHKIYSKAYRAQRPEFTRTTSRAIFRTSKALCVHAIFYLKLTATHFLFFNLMVNCFYSAFTTPSLGFQGAPGGLKVNLKTHLNVIILL